MEKSTFVESLKRNIATLLNDDHGKAVLAPDNRELGDDEVKQVITVGDFVYTRIAIPVKGGKPLSIRPKVLWKGEQLGEDLAEGIESSIRETLQELDAKVDESEHNLPQLLPTEEDEDVKALRVLLGDPQDPDNPVTLHTVATKAKELSVTLTIGGKDGSIRLRKVD